MVAHLLWEQGVAGSNPAAPIETRACGIRSRVGRGVPVKAVEAPASLCVLRRFWLGLLWLLRVLEHVVSVAKLVFGPGAVREGERASYARLIRSMRSLMLASS